MIVTGGIKHERLDKWINIKINLFFLQEEEEKEGGGGGGWFQTQLMLLNCNTLDNIIKKLDIIGIPLII